MRTSRIFPSESSQQGVVLLETLISILIFSMAILAIIGLQAAMVKNTTEAKSRADASYIAQQRIGTMWADPANADAYIETNTDISELLPGGLRSVAAIAGAPGQYQITITWQAPGEQQHNFTTIATIAGG
jgi:type IV pilus assembly protein PilV